jgi:predicted transposase YbfD/YdcC
VPASSSSLIVVVADRLGGLEVDDPGVVAPALREALAAVLDPRARRGVRYRLVTVLLVAVCAVLAGARSFVAIAEWAHDLPATISETLGIARRCPSESTIRRVVQNVDADRFDVVIGAWVQQRCLMAAPKPATSTQGGRGRIHRAVAVDGKTLRGSRTAQRPGRHLLGALDHDAAVVLGQVEVDGKSSEIAAFAPLLDNLELTDVMVTADALHTQREHTDYLARRGAHWVFTVKGNQPTLRAQLTGLPWRQTPVGHRDARRAHGRREIRTIKTVTIDARDGGIVFPHAAQAIQITRRTRPASGRGRWRTETVYAITDLAPHQAHPAQLAAWIRGHWQVEALHWVRDVTFTEDHSQIRTGSAPQVMATLRNLVISILRLAGATNIAAALRHHARDATRPLATLGIT